MTCVFTISDGVWQVCILGRVLPTTWHSRGAALAFLKRCTGSDTAALSEGK